MITELIDTVADTFGELFHYGTPRHSGRYPWGSGDDPYQRAAGFMKTVGELRNQGMSETEIAKSLGMTTTEYRAKKSMAKANKRNGDTQRALNLKEKGYSNTKIGEIMGINESSVRSLLNPTLKDNNDKTKNVADMLMREVDKKGYIDVGAGVEREIGVPQNRLNNALALAKENGYALHRVKVEQATMPGQFTTVKVLAPPGTEWKDILHNTDKIKSIQEYTVDTGETFFGIEPPKSLSSSRIKIRYGDEQFQGTTGSEMDGVIQLRRGVEDISLGKSSYAQVRIAVDGTHYLKGMAIYSDNMPDGVDIIYNTNKKAGTPKEKVFKELKPDPDNPFGAVIKAGGQRHYIDADGNDQLSCINKIKEEGDWSEYSKTLASQMLGKQSMKLITNQLNLSYADKKAEYDEICALTNPSVKKRLLESFADDCDASAVHLKAAALPRQASKVILPVPELKDNEVYAPTYKDGENVALIRYPHGGTFEIPILKVNNKHAVAKDVLGNAMDAIGINSKVAERLSGADFDGDTVVVIPCNTSGNKVKITSTPALEGLKGFDTKRYKFTDEELEAGAKVISHQRMQTEMGKASNLITDMTLRGATPDELARATRHSMVVIDSEKHKLNYQQSYIDNNIAELKEKYQGGATKGASTLISRAKSVEYVNERKDWSLNPNSVNEDGSKKYEETGRTYTNKKGKEVVATEKSTKMAEATDARKLSSGTPQEEAYAQYANKLKALANEARKEYLATKNTEYNPAAKAAYKNEVDSLEAKLDIALKNAPRERQAQLIAYNTVASKKKDNPDMSASEIKKASQQALAAARNRTGAHKERVKITDREWEAIQAGAISTNKLSQILNNCDLDEVKQKATPRATTTVSPAKQSRMKAMSNSGYTISEIAEALGVSTSTVSKQLKAA